MNELALLVGLGLSLLVVFVFEIIGKSIERAKIKRREKPNSICEHCRAGLYKYKNAHITATHIYPCFEEIEKRLKK